MYVCVCMYVYRCVCVQGRLYSTMGPRARQCSGALMTTILVGPPGKCPLDKCAKTAMCVCVCVCVCVCAGARARDVS